MLIPKILLVSNKFDFSTDFIAIELNKQGITYLRLNRDELKNNSIQFNPLIPEITGIINEIEFKISKEYLSSIYFRAPCFLRDIFQVNISEEEQLSRTQWAAFVRSLIVFENVKWLNNPSSIYQAEIKAYQLYVAKNLGFNVPSTVISNVTIKLGFPNIAIKSIDTAIVNKNNEEGFVYTNIYKQDELNNTRFSSPFFIQQGLVPKIDIRVTIIENQAIAFSIHSKEKINDDWRKYKNSLEYTLITLPKEIESLCIEYVKKLKLNFGAIDLILYNNDYYFIEINPTGEWAWLQQNSGFRIDQIIVNSLK